MKAIFDEPLDAITVKLPVSLSEAFRRAAKADERTVSGAVRKLIRDSLAENDEGRPATSAPVQTSVEQDRRVSA